MSPRKPESEAAARQRLDAEEMNSLAIRLVELIYDASIEPSRWQLFIDTLCEVCGDAAGALVLQVAEPNSRSYAFRRALDPGLSGVVNRHHARGLPWKNSEPRYGQEFVFGSDFFPDEQLPATDFYREYMAPQKLAPEAPLVFAMNADPARPLASVVLYRREGCRKIDEQDRALCNSLVPHLMRAREIHVRLHAEREQRRALAEVVDRFPMGVVLVDGLGRCVALNAAAKRIFDQRDGVRLDRNRPVLDDDKRSEELHLAIAQAADSGSTGANGTLHVIAVERGSAAEPYTLAVTPLRESNGDASAGDAVAAIFIADPDVNVTSLPALEELYSLTPAESALVAHLVTGRSIEEVAELRNIRTSTARGYLKSIYRKTKTSSQRQLVRLVLTGVSPIGPRTEPTKLER